MDKLRLGTTDANPLASLLGDAEGPAHEDWDTSEERPNRAWKTWKGRVKFCRRIVDALVELLSPPTNKADFDLLADFFSIERAQSQQRSRNPRVNGRGPADFGGITPTPRWFRLVDRPGGFRIAADSRKAVSPDAKLQVSVAYDLPSGNPLRKWCAFDFDFKQSNRIIMKGKNVRVKQIAGNILSLYIEDEQFSFSVEGFDEYRDLFVRVEEIDDSGPDTSQTGEGGDER